MKKELQILYAITVLSLITAGCNSSEKMIEKSGISNNPNYINYQNNKNAGNITDDDYSIDVMPYVYDEDFTIPENSVHITFAQNSNLDVTYSTDAQFTTHINNKHEYYLTEGQTLYAKCEVSDNVNNDSYKFHGYYIYEYKQDTLSRIPFKPVSTDQGYIIQFSDELIGKELSIEPVGEYTNREIKLNDYYLDDNNRECQLNGTWLINDKEEEGDKAEIGPNTSYIVSYMYDSDLYYVVDTVPKSFYYDHVDGLVVFEKQIPSADSALEFKVNLKEYSSFRLPSLTDRTIWYNDVETKIRANESFPISKLVYGQKIEIKTDKEWESLKTMENELLCINESISLDGKFYTYTLLVHTPGEEFYFDPADYDYEHGEVVFTCFDKEITGPTNLPYGVTVYCTQKRADDGYYLPETCSVKISNDDDKTREDFKNITFIEVAHIKVPLQQPDYGGKIIYSFEGNSLVGKEVVLDSGSVIDMEFIPWKGWYVPNEVSNQYTVTSDSDKTIEEGINDIISNVFIEDEDHKPTLDIYLDKSIGTNMTVSVKDYAPEKLKYDNWIRDEHIVDGVIMSTTAEGVIITAEGSALPSGKALKIEMVKKTRDNTKITKVWYRSSINLKEERFPIYDDLATDEEWYKSIEITLSVVDISVFDAGLIKHKNVTVSVKEADTLRELENGDLIEPDAKIIININPSIGYYLEDTDSLDYEETMKYSKFEENISDIFKKHEPHKYITVTLDKSDNYATYTYEVKSGKNSPVTETVNADNSITVSFLKEDNEIELKYEIIDGNHKLKNSYGITFSHTKATKTIKITSDMDGKILERIDFGIE